MGDSLESGGMKAGLGGEVIRRKGHMSAKICEQIQKLITLIQNYIALNLNFWVMVTLFSDRFLLN